MERQCPLSLKREHTESFARINSEILQELQRREIPGLDDPAELAMALSVLVADALSIDVYRGREGA